MSRLATSPLAPWAGLFLGALAWFGQHQTGADVNTWNCQVGNGGLVVLAGFVAALVAAAGGLISWISRPPEDVQNRRFARFVGVGGAGVFLLAIGFQTLAGLLVPACLR